ncbi:uncharacterized protein LOC128254899 isoform X2 [Drosophila gunungcola]|uniref:uncharacterized protein LOC128254899 isoform X2 n=1 Tax=Drosophila gunungcola TaxID=103775 RepID=UPI0022E22F58|nr:uncharacterized protein LOC128254899 isoform X2 [Drosophila gunungcola]
MKASLFVCVILVAIFFMLVSGRNSSTTDEGIQPCRRSVQKSCTSTKMTCGRLGKANICQAFKNDCQRQLSNCDPKKFYRKVHQNLCRGMPVDVVRPCGS